MAETYKIVRTYLHYDARTLATGLTLDEAQAWCRDPETSSSTATKAVNVRRTERMGHWCDDYEKE
jgi:hypothetical protein